MHFSCMSTCRGVMSTSHFSLENANRHVDISLLKWDVDISVKTAIPYTNFLNVLHARFILQFPGPKFAQMLPDRSKIRNLRFCSHPRENFDEKTPEIVISAFDLTLMFFSRAENDDISRHLAHMRCQHVTSRWGGWNWHVNISDVNISRDVKLLRCHVKQLCIFRGRSCWSYAFNIIAC